MKELFLKLFSAKTEKEISKIIYNEIDIFGVSLRATTC